jgi:DNA-binding response OmpR family regulator
MVQQDGAPPDTNPGLDVLVVDDDRDTADSLAILLRLWGHRARVAYGAEAALLAAGDEPPEVVLLDLGLPGMNGFALGAGLRALNGMRDALVIAITGHTHLAHRDRDKECRFADVLIKPVEPETLRRLLADRQTVRTRPDPAAPAATVPSTRDQRLGAGARVDSGEPHRTFG